MRAGAVANEGWCRPRRRLSRRRPKEVAGEEEVAVLLGGVQNLGHSLCICLGAPWKANCWAT